MDRKKTFYYGGKGFEGLPEFGKYEVHYNYSSNESKHFLNLTEAKEFYDGLGEYVGKAFWDNTGAPELIDAMLYAPGEGNSNIQTDDDLPF